MSESRIRLNVEGAGPFAKTFETNDGVEDVNAQAVVLTDGTTGAEKGVTAAPLCTLPNPGELELSFTIVAPGSTQSPLATSGPALGMHVDGSIQGTFTIYYSMGAGPLEIAKIRPRATSTIPVAAAGELVDAVFTTPGGVTVFDSYYDLVLPQGATGLGYLCSAHTVGGVAVSFYRAGVGSQSLEQAINPTGESAPPQTVQVGGSDGTSVHALRVDTTGREIVVGAAADGAAVAGNPVLVAGQDGTNAQSIKTDTTGRVEVVAQGAAADGAAVSGNPVLVAGQDGTNAQSILTDTTGRQVMVGAAADGAAVTGNPVLIAGQDGTNAQSIRTDNLGNQQVVGSVAAGAATLSNPVLVGSRDGSFNAQFLAIDTSGRPLIGGGAANGAGVAGNPVVMAGVVGGIVRSLLTDASGRPNIVGAAGDGTAVTGNPVLMGGQDGTNAQSILTDTTGRQVMVGAAADGAAVAGNPVLMGGQDGTNAQSILTDTTGRQVMVGAAADGAAVTGNPVLIGGQDGTNAQSIKTDTNGRIEPGGLGTLANGAETAVSSAAVSVLAANTNRKAAILQNVGANTVRVGIAGVTATTGIQLVAGATLVLEEPFVPTAELFAIRESADSTVFATEIT